MMQSCKPKMCLASTPCINIRWVGSVAYTDIVLSEDPRNRLRATVLNGVDVPVTNSDTLTPVLDTRGVHYNAETAPAQDLTDAVAGVTTINLVTATADGLGAFIGASACILVDTTCAPGQTRLVPRLSPLNFDGSGLISTPDGLDFIAPATQTQRLTSISRRIFVSAQPDASGDAVYNISAVKGAGLASRFSAGGFAAATDQSPGTAALSAAAVAAQAQATSQYFYDLTSYNTQITELTQAISQRQTLTPTQIKFAQDIAAQTAKNAVPSTTTYASYGQPGSQGFGGAQRSRVGL